MNPRILVFAASFAMAVIAPSRPALAIETENQPDVGAKAETSADREIRLRKAREKWEALPAEEREKILQRYREWKQLPDEGKHRLRKNLEHMRKLPPPARQQLMRNLQRFESMPPEKQEQLMQNYRRWQQIPPERKRELRERWQKMPPERREQFLKHFMEKRGADAERQRPGDPLSRAVPMPEELDPETTPAPKK